MALENSDGQEKSEDPTGKRLSETRGKGQLARSKELTTMGMTVGGALMLLITGPHIHQGLVDMLTRFLSFDREELFTTEHLIRRYFEAIGEGLWLIAPLVGALMLVAIISTGLLDGFVFTWEPLKPNFGRFNVLSGLKRMFALNGLVGLGKALAKFFLVVGVVIYILWADVDDILALPLQDFHLAIIHTYDTLGWSFFYLALSLVLLALVDVPYQIWSHKRQLKMTKQEVKDEHKNQEGNPQVKAKIRRMMYQMAASRMMEAVPKADVVVTNPTHYAVALRYEQGVSSAPRVVAMGVDMVALNIRKVAQDAGVPVMELPPLARALYHTSDLGDMIPEGLYLAVARVLAYVYQLKAAKKGMADYPDRPYDVPIPEDMKY